MLKAMLINSAVDMDDVAGYPNGLEGWGVIRLQNVLFFEDEARNLKVEDNRAGISTTETHQHEFIVADGGKVAQLKVVLVWTDPPPHQGALARLVNDLDLVVVSPNGTQTLLGNVFERGASRTGGYADRVNNVEVVLKKNPMPGKWTVKVLGTAVNGGPQPYALVMTMLAVAPDR